ncbi:MAG: hypothetical protein ACYCZ6_02350 [Polaromonas sp.]
MVKILVLIPVALIAILVLTFGFSEKDRLDAEAKRLCAIDGGVKVYEMVTLPPEAFYENGLPKLANDKAAEIRWGYQRIYTYVNLKTNFDEPTLIRNEYRIVRTSDGKVIATSVVYGRSGGSWWGGLVQGDGFQCPASDAVALENKVFLKGATK